MKLQSSIHRRSFRRRRGACAALAAAAIAFAAVAAAMAAPAAQKKLATAATAQNHAPFGPDNFPIAVWLQDPQDAARYRQAGINLYIGLWQGPTEAQLAILKAAHMPVMCIQNAVGLRHRDDPTIVGWTQQDEPDNAQPVTDPATGKQGYGPCVPPGQVTAEYKQIRAADPTRPVLLNLGEGVANDAWIGRGASASLGDYQTYVQGGDILSFDVYPIASLGPDGANLLWYVPKGIDRLISWTGGRKPIWAVIECTHIDDPQAQATPAQVRAEVWMALIHGAHGIVYFCHQFQPAYDGHALLDDPTMLAAVTALNGQVHAFAPVLNSPTLTGVAAVRSSLELCPIALLVKRRHKTMSLFAVGMRNTAVQGNFTVAGLPPIAYAEVLGEGRTLKVKNGRFTDDFAPYGIHIYRIQEVAP
jgi:hypothetical protein